MNLYSHIFYDEDNKYIVMVDVTKEYNKYIATYTRKAYQLNLNGFPEKGHKEGRIVSQFCFRFDDEPTLDDFMEKAKLAKKINHL